MQGRRVTPTTAPANSAVWAPVVSRNIRENRAFKTALAEIYTVRQTPQYIFCLLRSYVLEKTASRTETR